jgi:hypothetical protein
MPIANVHPADPDSPKGMAWVLAAGFPDPRPGGHPNQQLVLVQGWEPWSELMWDLGLRWHPELQNKWITGGGQFSVGELTGQKPETAESLETQCDEVLDMIAESQPGFVSELRRIRDEGTDGEKTKAVSELRRNVMDLMKLVQYVEGGGQQ